MLHIAKTPDDISTSQSAGNTPANTPSVATPSYVPPTSPAPSSTTPNSIQVKVKNLQVVALSEAPISKDKQGQEWYEVSFFEDKSCKTGWISKKDSNIDTVTQHDWKKLGFTVVEVAGIPVEKAIAEKAADKKPAEPSYECEYSMSLTLDLFPKLAEDEKQLNHVVGLITRPLPAAPEKETAQN